MMRDGRAAAVGTVLAAALGLAPLGLGVWLLRSAVGEVPQRISPYAPADDVGMRPSPATIASPILLLTTSRADNPFGRYLAEILRAEGLNCFQTADVSAIDRAAISRFDVVILTEGPLDPPQVELLESYVDGGGRLIVMRPDARLAALLGIQPVAGTTSEGYLRVDPHDTIADGIVPEALQFHGSANHYRAVGAEVIAWLEDVPGERGEYPALAVFRHGRGQAAMWAYDLARSVAYTRQGNPAWAGQERDGLEGIRASDMFKGWIDLDRIAIPQADEQQRLLANLLSALTQEIRPLPRLWYFPGDARAVLIATGDAHAAQASAVEAVLSRTEQRGGHASIYYAPPLLHDWRRALRKVRWWASTLPVFGETFASANSGPSPALVAAWRARGHEFGLHPSVEGNLDAGLGRYWQEFSGLGYGPLSPTLRTHRILWTGWVETARVQASCGVRMNLDYYHHGPTFRRDGGDWVYGYFTGSGLPMKFVDQQGRVLNIYQQLTALADEQLIEVPWGSQAHLTPEAAVGVSRMLLQRSMNGSHGAIAAQFHVDPYALGGDAAATAARWLEGTLDSAAAEGVPIWSAADWLHFTEARHNATFEDIQWDPIQARLAFVASAQGAPPMELSVMVPMQHGHVQLSLVQIDGRPAAFHERVVGGVRYGCVSVGSGAHRIVADYA